MQLNARTQILRRHTVLDISKVTEKDVEPPSIDALSQIFHKDGIDLAVSACTKAMEEAKVSASEITHVVAVTCTDQGNPGFDLLVCQKLGLLPSVQRTLLHGVGCAGGLSALRAAADTAAASYQKSQPACVLVIACELCSLFLQAELQAASQDDALHIAPALFSDAAAALVVCNKLAIREGRTPIYELQGWSSMLVPDTVEHMSYEIKPQGTPLYSPYDGPETDNFCRLDSYYHGQSPQDRHRRDIAHLCPPRCRLYSSGLRLGNPSRRCRDTTRRAEVIEPERRPYTRVPQGLPITWELFKSDSACRFRRAKKNGKGPRQCRRYKLWSWDDD
jgi:hypothetical protein